MWVHGVGFVLLVHASRSTYVSSIIAQNLYLNLLLETQSHSFTHLSFALTVGLCAYNFFRAVTLDPGTCPKPASDGELKSVGHSNLNIVYVLMDVTDR